MNISNIYTEAENYILDIPKFAGKHTLADTRKLLEQITGGVYKSKIIHVAGTNGKGSVCTYLRAVLETAGYSVGVFTSPHLVSMRERICIGSEMISEADFVSAYEAVLRTVQDMQEQVNGEERSGAETNQEERSGAETIHDSMGAENLHPSFFEFLFLMAMIYFKEKEPDYVILETGLGGRLDATNAIPKKEISVITRIGLDHTEYLGETLEEIAGEKAGIMKAGTPVVYWQTGDSVSQVFAKKTDELQICAYPVSKEDYTFLNFNNKNIDFSYRSIYYDNIRLCLNTIACYQMENASLAMRALEVLMGKDNITPEDMQKGLKKAFWAGRMEEIRPEVFVDGAHNGDGIRAFLETVSRDGCVKTRHLLFGVVQDKDFHHMIKEIADSGLFADIAVVRLKSARTADMKQLRDTFSKTGQDIVCYETVKAAFEAMLSKKQEGERLYIAGSLYLVGEIKELV